MPARQRPDSRQPSSASSALEPVLVMPRQSSRQAPSSKHRRATRASRPYVYTVGTRLGRKACTANNTPTMRTFCHGRPPTVYTYGQFVYTVGTRLGRKACTVRAVLAGDAKKCARQGTLRAGKCTRRSRAAPRVYTVGNVLGRRTGKAGGLTPRMHAAGNLLARKVCTAFLSLDVTAFVRTPCRPPSSLTQKPRFRREDDGRAHQLPRRRVQHHRQRV